MVGKTGKKRLEEMWADRRMERCFRHTQNEIVEVFFSSLNEQVCVSRLRERTIITKCQETTTLSQLFQKVTALNFFMEKLTKQKIQHGCSFGIIPSLSYLFSIFFS